MALRKLRIIDDEILLKRSKEVKRFDESLKKLSLDMIETMYESEGVGLAAVQIGILKRLFVYDPQDSKGARVIVNPEITFYDGDDIKAEGCLSIPNRSGYVKRSTHLLLKAQDVEGKPIEYEAKDYEARIIQHEFDHLNGVLFIDKVIEDYKEEE